MTGMGDISRELVALFEPQVEQLGVRLERQGGIWVGEARGSMATGSMWLCAPAPHCLVLCHDVTPGRRGGVLAGLRSADQVRWRRGRRASSA